MKRRERLRRRRESLEDFLNDPPELQAIRLLRTGISDPEEAAKRLFADDQEAQLIEKQLEALDEVRRLRRLAVEQP